MFRPPFSRPPPLAQPSDSGGPGRAHARRFDASGAQSRAAWASRMEEICAEDGYFEPLGPAHYAFFADQGPVLLVSFESLQSISARPNRMPEALGIALPRGWSQLCLIAAGETWYRDPAVWRYFDRLVDDAFFEDFDRVVFYGAGMGGYAACAFSVCAAGATVLAMAPPATLSPARAGWDDRHPAARRLDFTSRFGYGPDMIEGAGHSFILCDPQVRLDAMHATLYARPCATILRAPGLGPDPAAGLRAMGLLESLITAAAEGRLTATLFYSTWRRRHASPAWAEALALRCEATGHPARAARIRHMAASNLPPDPENPLENPPSLR